MKRFVAIFSAAMVLAAAEVPIAPLGVYTPGRTPPLGLPAAKRSRSPDLHHRVRQSLGEVAHRRLPAGRTQESRTETRAARRPRHAHPPRDLRPHRPAAHPRRDRRLPRRQIARTPGRKSWTVCWPRRTTANSGAATGSTSSASPRAMATSTTCTAPTPGAIAITWCRVSTATSPTTNSSKSNSPATRSTLRTRPSSSPAASTASVRCARTPATRTWPARTTKCSPR